MEHVSNNSMSHWSSVTYSQRAAAVGVGRRVSNVETTPCVSCIVAGLVDAGVHDGIRGARVNEDFQVFAGANREVREPKALMNASVRQFLGGQWAR